MTNQEFRVKTLGLFAKAEFINENIDFAKAEINLSLQTSKGENYYIISISIYEYNTKVHYITFTSAAYNALDLLRDISDLLDNYIEELEKEGDINDYYLFARIPR